MDNLTSSSPPAITDSNISQSPSTDKDLTNNKNGNNDDDLNNLIVQFFTKCVSIIFDQRTVTVNKLPNNMINQNNAQIDDFWFNIHTNLATIPQKFRDFLYENWQTFSVSSTSINSGSGLPPPLIVEVFLDLRELQHGQKLYLEDQDSHPWLVVKGPRKSEVVLERWLVELTQLPSASSHISESINNDSNTIYEKISLMLKSLQKVTELLPTYQLSKEIRDASDSNNRSKFQNLSIQARILDGRNKISTKGRIGLTKHLIGTYDHMCNEIDSVEINTERKIFEPLPTKFGMLRISLQFRKDAQFYFIGNSTQNDKNKTSKELPQSSVELAALLKSSKASPSPPPQLKNSSTPPQHSALPFHISSKNSPSFLLKQPQNQGKTHYTSSFSSNNAHSVPKYSSSFGSMGSSTTTVAVTGTNRASSFNNNNSVNSPLLFIRSNSTVNSMPDQTPQSHIIYPPVVSHSQQQHNYFTPHSRRKSLDEELHTMSITAIANRANRLIPAASTTEDRDDIHDFLHSISGLHLSSASSPTNVSRSSSVSSSLNNKHARFSTNNNANLKTNTTTTTSTLENANNDDALPSQFMNASTTLNKLTSSLSNFSQDLPFLTNNNISNNLRRSHSLRRNAPIPSNFLLSGTTNGGSDGIMNSQSPGSMDLGAGIRYSGNSTSMSPKRRFSGGTNFSNSAGTSPVFTGAGTTTGIGLSIPLSSSQHSNNYNSNYGGQSVPSSFGAGGIRRSRYISHSGQTQVSLGHQYQHQQNNNNNSVSMNSMELGKPASLGMLMSGNVSNNNNISGRLQDDSVALSSVPTNTLMSMMRRRRTHRGSNTSNMSNYSTSSSLVSGPPSGGISLPGLMSSASPSAIITTTNAYGKMNIDEGKISQSSSEELRRSVINASNNEITIEEDSELKGGTSSGEQHVMSNSSGS